MRIVDLHPSFFVLLAVGALILWRIWVRMRRLVGRQRLAPVWPWLAVTFFPAIVAGLFAIGLVADPPHALATVAGALAGGLLGWLDLRLTRFERTPDGWFYTPSAPIGLGLAALFVGRLTYRAWALSRADSGVGKVVAGFGDSPLTLAMFGLFAGHYAAYAAGLLHWRHVRSVGLSAGDDDAGEAPSSGNAADPAAASSSEERHPPR